MSARSLTVFLEGVVQRNPGQSEFHQAVEEVATSLYPWYQLQTEYREAKILERLTEPDRVISFRVTWETDKGEICFNRAWRVQFSQALGPYKGGLRFHPSVNESILKFLAFEQILKNSLTGLPMGGAKGGSNFNPKGRSDREIMRFCQSLMNELQRHIGENVDIPAGDIGVGGREISYLFGHYLRLRNRWAGILTGKTEGFGGSPIRVEATGYGCVYFCELMLEHHGKSIEGQKIAISGSGNVALHAAEMALQKGAKVISLSDSDGTVRFKKALSEQQLEFVRELKIERRGRVKEIAEKFDDVDFKGDTNPWGLDCDIAMPCATQNELDAADAENLVKNGLIAVCEGANMPTTKGAASVFQAQRILHAPGKAANSGGVAVSGIELSQNLTRVPWSTQRVCEKLKELMADIHGRCVDNSPDGKQINYVDAANLAGFRRVAKAMLAYGVA